ncbi:hypothetical protein PG985_010921 [Apiospora marii]|uniref:uncharacterized protein n=1 Tax=Apiospora marii TaxID=335849 RepID=UPI00312EAE6A
MDNYPTPPYNSYGDPVSDMVSGQAFLDFDLDLEGDAMSAFGEAMAGTQGYFPHQDYTHLDYPQQECISPSVIDPTGGNSDPNLGQGFSNYMYEDYGGMPVPNVE